MKSKVWDFCLLCLSWKYKELKPKRKLKLFIWPLWGHWLSALCGSVLPQSGAAFVQVSSPEVAVCSSFREDQPTIIWQAFALNNCLTSVLSFFPCVCHSVACTQPCSLFSFTQPTTSAPTKHFCSTVLKYECQPLQCDLSWEKVTNYTM